MTSAQTEADRRRTLRHALSPPLVNALDELWDHHREVEQRRAAAREQARQRVLGNIPEVEVVSAQREDQWAFPREVMA